MKASRFRLDFDSRKPGERAIIEELDLRGGYRDPQWVAKTGFATDHVALHMAKRSNCSRATSFRSIRFSI